VNENERGDVVASGGSDDFSELPSAFFDGWKAFFEDNVANLTADDALQTTFRL